MSGLLLQGRHGVGKSTLLHRALANSSLQCGGYYVQRILQDDRTKGFRCCALTSPIQLTTLYDRSMDSQLFIDCTQEQHQVHIERFVQAAGSALSSPIPQLLVLDELGGVELLDDAFFELLTLRIGSCPVVGSYKSDSNATMLQQQAGVNQVRLTQRRQLLCQKMQADNIRLVDLTQDNTDEVSAVLTSFLKGVQ